MPQNDENQANSFQDLRESLILAAALHAPFTGWCHETLVQAALDVEIELNTAEILFPNPAIDLALGFHQWGDKQLEKAASDLAPMKIREKITYLVHARIEILAPYKEAVRRSASLLALPLNIGFGARAVWKTIDLVWRLVGDTSKDYNWYTKRTTLMGVYSSTLLYFLSDTSPNSQSTWDFLDRRIEDVMKIEKLKASAKNNSIMQGLFWGPSKILGCIKAPEDERPGTRVGLPGN